MKKQEKDYVVYTISLQGKVMYVGSSENFERRKREHLQQKGYSSIPTDVDPSTVTIEIVRHWKSEKAMLNSEGRLIKKYDTIKNGWNKVNSGLVTSNKYEYWKEYNANRKEKLNEYMKVYMRSYDKEKKKEYSRRWYEKHKKIKIAD